MHPKISQTARTDAENDVLFPWRNCYKEADTDSLSLEENYCRKDMVHQKKKR